ncbi:MAG: pyruvate kinase, partial [Candidatus Puniceispirillales bacterium]
MTLHYLATRILVTLGPASNSRDMIKTLALAGASAFRLNFSHGTQDMHKETYDYVRDVAKELNLPLTILADLQGPKLRVSTVKKGTELKPGDQFVFDNIDEIGDSKRVYLPHPEIFDAILPGHRMLV